MLWVFEKLDLPYSIEGIHFRWYINFAEEPGKYPVRFHQDGPPGPKLPSKKIKKFLEKEREKLQEPMANNPAFHSHSDGEEDDGTTRGHQTTDHQIRRMIAPLVDELYMCSEAGMEVAEFVQDGLGVLIEETRAFVKLKWNRDVEDLRMHRSSGQRAGKRPWDQL
jgi:hypothetical protein